MSDILIIGNSLTAAAAIEEIRRTDASSSLTLFCPEGALPYQRHLLPALVAKDIKDAQLLAAPEAFFHRHNVKVASGEALARVSLKRKQITTENKVHLPFDKLLLTDLPQVKFPPVKGSHRQGVFNALQWTAAKDLVKYLPYADHIVVSVSNFAGLNMACALSRLGKEVVMVAGPSGLLAQAFDDETTSLLKQIMEAKGLRIVFDGLESVLGDAEAKAVRLASGKVMAAEMVVFDEAAPDLRALADTGLTEGERIPADPFFQTASGDVLACAGALGQFDLSPEEASGQGRCAAANLLSSGSSPYQTPVGLRDFGLKVCDGFCGGALRLQEGGRERMKFDGPQNVYKKIYLVNDCLVGAVWFNAAQDRDKVRRALAGRLSLAGAEDQFLQSSHS